MKFTIMKQNYNTSLYIHVDNIHVDTCINKKNIRAYENGVFLTTTTTTHYGLRADDAR